MIAGAAVSWGLAALAFALCAAVAAWGAERVLTGLGAPRRLAWVVALCIAVVWPPVAYVVTSRTIESVPAAVSPVTGVGVVAPETALLPSPALPVTDITSWLLATWAMLSVFVAVHAWRGSRSLVRARDAAEPCVLQQARVLRTTNVGPAVFGLRDPVLLLPSWVWELEPSLQSLVLRHEQEHCRAGDTWLLWLTVVSRIVMPWNPVVWWIGHRVRLALEIDCDTRTLRADPSQGEHYARLLLLITQFRQRAHARAAHFAPALLPLPSHLRRRITAMHSSPASNRPLSWIAAVVLVGLAGLSACSRQIAGNLAGPANAPSPVTAQQEERSQSTDDAKEATSAASSDKPYFDFQVEQPATVMREGSRFPVYPPALRAANVPGIVLTQFVVGTDGAVEPGSVRILRSTNDAFGDAVREAVPSMRFRPATIGGRAVRQLVQQPFTFALDGTPPATLDSLNAQAVRPAPAPAPARQMSASDTSARFDFQVEQPAYMAPNTVGPAYPADLRTRGIEGAVLVQFVVNVDGTADAGSIRVLKSDHEAFTQAVREALGRMRFVPAMAEGRAVRQVLQQPFQFSVQR